MHYVYVLKSEKDGQMYIGSTSDVQKRLAEHNGGMVFSTKPRRPFELVYYEAYKSEQDARVREARLKMRSRAFEQLKRRIDGSLKMIGARPPTNWGSKREKWQLVGGQAIVEYLVVTSLVLGAIGVFVASQLVQKKAQDIATSEINRVNAIPEE